MLVYDQQVAQDVSAVQNSGVLGSRFIVEATARDGVSAEKLEQALNAAIEKLLKDGVTADEAERARNGVQMSFVSGLQGVMERASLLNLYQAEVGRPDYVAEDLGRFTRATPESITAAARAWLRPERRGVLWVVPAPAAAAQEQK
jgi:zinc protease